MYYIGLDIGGTKCAATLGDCGEEIRILKKEQFLTKGLSPQSVLQRFSCFIDECLQAYKVQGIGISCGGPLDSKRGVILSPPSLPDWDHIEIKKYFEEKYGVRTLVQNDANAGAVAEWKYGAAKGYDNVVFITCGTGFGAGLILNGKLYAGTNDNAGELGHVRLTKNGPLGFHKNGSVEGYCSGGGIARLARLEMEKEQKRGRQVRVYEEMGAENVDAKTLADYARAGDPFCQKIYKKSGEKLGAALSILIDLLNPEIIVIGGVFMRSSDLLLPHALKTINRESLALSAEVCKIVPAKLNENIGDISALTIAQGEY